MKLNIRWLRDLFFLIGMVVPLIAYSFSVALEDAAKAVARLGEKADPKYIALVFQNNKTINEMALLGMLPDDVYQANQRLFKKMNNGFIQQAAIDAGLKARLQATKPGAPERFNAGTDTDVLVDSTSGEHIKLDDIKAAEDSYQNQIREYLESNGLKPEPGKIDTDTDFMPNADHTSAEEFRRINRHVNKNGGTAYESPGAARVEAKLRPPEGEEIPRLTIDETGEYVGEMQRLARKKLAHADALDALAKQTKDPFKAQKLLAEAQLARSQSAKYLRRVEKVSNVLASQNNVKGVATSTDSLGQSLDDIGKQGRGVGTAGQAGIVGEFGELGVNKAVKDYAETLSRIAGKNPKSVASIQRQIAEQVQNLSPGLRDAIIKRSVEAFEEVADSVGAVDRFARELAAQIDLVAKGAIGSRAKNLLLSILKQHLDDVDYEKALKAVNGGNLDDLPVSARRIIGEVESVAKMRLVSLTDDAIEEFMRRSSEGFPRFRLSKRPNDESLRKLIQLIETEELDDGFIAVFGAKPTERLRRVKALTPPHVKAQVRLRFSQNKFMIWEMDRKGQVLLGDAGATLKFDAAIGIATGFYQTWSIMDRNLSPEDEYRELLNAWGTALPIIGDIASGIIEVAEYTATGETAHLFKSALWMGIATAGVVPGVQLPAMVAGLSMMTYEASKGMFDVHADRKLVDAWLESGYWDRKRGKLKKMFDKTGVPHELSFKGLLTNGNVAYMRGLEGVTIRDSIYQWAERNTLDNSEALQSFLRPLRKVYPGFDFRGTLREDYNTARSLLAAEILAHGGTPDRSIQMLMFRRAKLVVNRAANDAADKIRSAVEAEYQALTHTGSALKVFQQLEALGTRLRLPLVGHVNAISSEFSTYVKGSLTSPWTLEGLARRKVQLAERYLGGYLEIESNLTAIEKIFELAGIRAPRHNLTGYLEIDTARMTGLKAVYETRAILPARKQVERAVRETTDNKDYRFILADANFCEITLFRELAGILVRQVEAEDRRLLLEQWTGKVSAAEASRDRALRDLETSMKEESVDVNVNPLSPMATSIMGETAESDRDSDAENSPPVWEGVTRILGTEITVSLPTWRAWNSFGDSYEAAYAWTNVRWEGSQVYEEAIETQDQRIRRLDEEFTEASNTAVLDLGSCLAKLPKLIVTFSVLHPAPGDRLFAEAKITGGEISGDAKWQWQSKGEIELRDNGSMMAGLTAHGNGTVSVELIHEEKVIARASADLTIKPEDSEDEDEVDQSDVGDDTDGDQEGEGEGDADGEEEGEDEEELTKDTEYPAESPITAPAKVIAGTVFKVSVEPSAGIRDKVKNFKWGGPRFMASNPYKKSYDGQSMKMLVHPKDAFPHEHNIKNGKITYVYVELLNSSGEVLDESQAEIPVQLVSLGVELPEGYKGGADSTGFGADKSGKDGDSGWQTYSAILYLHWMSSGESIPEGYDETISIGEFKGRGKKGPLKFKGGSWSMGYVGCNAKQELSGVVEKDGMRLRVTVLGSATGFWDCRNKDWVMAKGAAIYQEALALANAAAHLTPHGSKLPKVDTSRYQVTTTKPTSKPPSQEDAGPFEVTGVPASPVYAAKAGISLHDKGKNPGSWKVLWQASEPGIEFDPPEGMNTQVTFGRMGSVMIWAQVLDPKDGSTVGEAPQEAAQVTGPRFVLSLNPAKPRVGEEIRASIISTPGISKDLVSFKWSSPASSNRMEYNDAASEVGFSLKDAKPLGLKAEAVAPVYGDVIGVIEGSIQATLYNVKVTARKYGPPALTWDPGKKGLVKAGPDVYLTGEEIRITAALEGTPKPATVNWKWQVNEGVTISNSNSQTPIVSRSTAGSIQAEVVATDKHKIVLGRSSISLSVGEPAHEPGAKDPGPTNATQVESLLGEARKQAEMGNMLPAEQAIEKIRRIDPGAAIAIASEVAVAAKKSGWQATYDRDFSTATRDLKVANRLAPRDKDAIDKLEKTERFAGIWPQVEARAREFDQLVAAKKVWSAQKAMLELQDLQFEMPGQMANSLSQEVTADFNQALKEYNDFMTEINSRHSQYFVEKNWRAMLENAEQSQARELSAGDAKEARGRIDFAKQMMSEDALAEQTGATLTPDQWATTTTGYPDIAGDWQEGNNRVHIIQDDAKITATCTYGNISWRMDGTITHEGVFLARLVHTAGVPSSATGFTQDRDLRLSPDGLNLEGTASFPGGGHGLRWTRTGSVADSSGGQFRATVEVLGTWSINAEGYMGKLELSGLAGALTGRVFFDAHQVWEDLAEISFNEALAELRFLRPDHAQHYVGTLEKNSLSGTFDSVYVWQAERVETTTQPDIPPQTQGQQQPGKAETGTGADPGFGAVSDTKEPDYFQLNFAETFNHKRPVKPYKVDDVPVSGYKEGEAYMVCLSKCQSMFNDGVCYPETYEWPVPSVNSNEIWITSNLFWWGNHAAGQPIARIIVSGDRGTKSYDIIGNGHTGEWNQNQIKPAPGVTIHDHVLGITGYESRFHIARFPYEQMNVSNIRIELLTANPWGDKFGVFAIYGVTLVGGEGEPR